MKFSFPGERFLPNGFITFARRETTVLSYGNEADSISRVLVLEKRKVLGGTCREFGREEEFHRFGTPILPGTSMATHVGHKVARISLLLRLPLTEGNIWLKGKFRRFQRDISGGKKLGVEVNYRISIWRIRKPGFSIKKSFRFVEAASRNGKDRDTTRFCYIRPSVNVIPVSLGKFKTATRHAWKLEQPMAYDAYTISTVSVTLFLCHNFAAATLRFVDNS